VTTRAAGKPPTHEWGVTVLETPVEIAR
jgi:hypothetical protein